MSEWSKVCLGELIKVKHGFAFPGQFITSEMTDRILVTPGNFCIGGGFKQGKFKYFSSHDYPAEYQFLGGELIVTMTDLSKETDTLGYSAVVPSDGKVYLHNQRVGLIEPISDQSCLEFVYWLMRWRDYQVFIVNSASGTSVMHTSPSRICEFEFELPPLPEQKAIASVLSSLDDKIDLLHRQNKTLEAMAETLFRQWFIEEAKEDWSETKVLDVFSLVGGGTPKTSEADYWDGDIPWLSGGDIANAHQGFIVRAEKAITELGLEKSSTKLLPKLASVISARGTVGKYAMLSRPMTFSQSNYGIIPKGHTHYYFVYLLLAYIVDELSAAAYGSVFDTITTRTFEDVELKLPPIGMITDFELEIAPLFENKLNNVEQIQTLENLRDTLLPKLMSGEVRVQYQTEEVA